MLAGRGVAGWLRVWHTTTLGPPQQPPVTNSAASDMAVGSDEMVGVLASMALACVDRR